MRDNTGLVEACAQTCWNAACDVLAEVSGACAQPISGLGLTAAMVGLWLLDADGNCVRPGINWEDNRSQKLLDRLMVKRPDLISEIFAISGSVIQQGCTLPLLAALAEQEPESVRKAHAAVSYKDFLRARLTGNIAIDRTEAAVAPGDARSQGASDALIHIFGLGEYKYLFPNVREGWEHAGSITETASVATGLPVGLPVAIGMGDVPAMVIGTGGLDADTAIAVLGTTCMLGRVSDVAVFDPPDLGLLFSLPGGNWFRAMVNIAGTLNLDWAMTLLAPDLRASPNGFSRLNEAISGIPIGARGLTYLPYLSASGIIAPVVDAHARAQFAGLTSAHNRAALLRAVFEGVAFAMADLADTLGLEAQTPLILCGGGSNSILWCDMIADVLERQILVPEGTEFGARGAAMLAAVMVGEYPDIGAASRQLRNLGGRTHRPNLQNLNEWRMARKRFSEHRYRLIGK